MKDRINKEKAKIRTALTVRKLYLNPDLKVSGWAEAIQSNPKNMCAS